MKTKIIIEEMLKKEGNKKNLAIVAGIAIILNSGKLKKEKLKGGRFYTDGIKLFNIIKQEVEDAKPFKVFKKRKLSVKENGNTPIFYYLEITVRNEVKIAKDLSRNCLPLLKINAMSDSWNKRGTKEAIILCQMYIAQYI